MNYKVLGSTGYAVDLPRIIAVDTEYTDLNIRKADLLSISVGASPNLTYILEWHEQIQRFLDHAEVIFAWNMTVDYYMLTKSGFKSDKSKWIDGMLLEHLVDERRDHGLGDFALREYQDDYKKEFWTKYDKYQDAPKDEAYEYEMKDGCYTYRAGLKYLSELKGKEALIEHVHNLQWALFDTEIEGIEVNVDLIRKTKLEMGNKIDGFLPRLREIFLDYCNAWEMEKWRIELDKRKTEKGKANIPRPTFRFSSDAQLKWLIYDAIGCPITEKTKKGSPKTDVDTIKDLSATYPQLELLAEYKETKSLYATFVEGMLDRVEGGRIYPRFNTNGTTTGRISHSNPNMGNLPRDGIIRNFFIPRDGMVIVGADYSQLEVVVEANLTEDKSLLKIILEGASKHDITAEGLKIPRDQAKTLNFALQYGAGAKKVSKILGLSYSDGEDIYRRYWEIYSGVQALKLRTAKELQEKGEVTNIFGRTRHFGKPENEFEKAKFERQAYNHLIQGVGADITNMATYRIASFLRANDIGRLWFSVHDEIVCEVQKDLTDIAKQHILKFMEVPNAYLNLKYPVSAKLYGPLDKWSKG